MSSFNINTYTALPKEQAQELVIMFAHFIKIMEEHNIDWWASCGTMMGAIRCGGLIRWDDDVDIAMEDSEYNKMKTLRKSIEGTKYRMKFVGQYGKLQHKAFIDDTNEASIWIDIFKTTNGIYPQKHCQICNAPDEMRLPLRKINYCGLLINIPQRAEELCDIQYVGWRHKAEVYNHRARKRKKVKGVEVFAQWGGQQNLGTYVLTDEANVSYVNI
jgi:phosphorylcholine metabolism protein LicD